MIYIELENNTPVKSTSNAEIAGKYFKNIITTDYPDYTPTNKKYKYENGEIILNPNYETERIKQEQTARIEEIKQELNELDKKRICAMCEPSEYAKGVSWLEYYNEQARELRVELQKLEGVDIDSNIKKYPV